MARILFIIAPKNFRDEEYAEPKAVLQNAGHECITASLTTDLATGMLGAQVKPDIAITDVDVNEFDAIVVVGGSGAPVLGEHEEVLQLLKHAAESGKIVCAICISPTILAKAGLLKGKKATVWSSPANREPIEILEQNGAQYIDQPVVVDGKIITANGPTAARAFGEKILEALGG